MKRKLLTILVLFLIALAPVATFYVRYEILVSHLKDDLGFDGSAANAVKHAYAAAQLYQASSVILSDQQADALVMSLGVINEYAERATKFFKPDSLREVMKDLHNNQAGIVAAQWQQQNSDDRAVLDVIIAMAQDNTLIVKRAENSFFEGEDQSGFGVVHKAVDWQRSHQDAISQRIVARLK